MRQRLLASLTLASAVFVLVYANAGAAQAASGKPSPVMQCATVLERIAPNSPDLRVKTDFCSTDPAAVAAVVPAASLVLARFYGGVNYTGAYRTTWVTSPCDSVGYHITDNRSLNSAVGGIASVILGSAGCTFIQAFEGTSFTGSVQSAYNGIPKITGAVLHHLWSAKMWVQDLPCVAAEATAC